MVSMVGVKTVDLVPSMVTFLCDPVADLYIAIETQHLGAMESIQYPKQAWMIRHMHAPGNHKCLSLMSLEERSLLLDR
jgi:hypothetical protein